MPMNKQWLELSAKFDSITVREQVLILLTGLVAIVMIIFTLSLDKNLANIANYNKNNRTLAAETKTLSLSINEFEMALKQDPNEEIKAQIARYESELQKIDGELLKLTSDLIDPIQMRSALLNLLQLQRGVSLLSFELIGAKPVIANQTDETSEQASTKQASSNKQDSEVQSEQNVADPLNLYRHGIRIKLSGSYFNLRDYLQKLEAISWKFFWHGFTYNVQEYPNSELVIEMYSLSTKREFIGV